jgi:hypothetical protein
MSPTTLSAALRAVLREMDRRAAGLVQPPVVYVVGAGALVLEGISRRATQDLDYVCDTHAPLFVNVLSPAGVYSHCVPPGLVSMPRGWRERAEPLPGFRARHVRVLLPELLDRMMDKLARGSGTDWDDLAAIAKSRVCPPADSIRERAATVLVDPPSSVFDAGIFRENLDRFLESFPGLPQD